MPTIIFWDVFYLAFLSFTSSFFQTRAATAICSQKRRRKADARKEGRKAPAAGAKSSQQSLCVFCLVINSQPSASSWLFFWIRTALFGPDPPTPHPHPSFLPPSLGDKRAARSFLLSAFPKYSCKKSSQTGRRQLCFCRKRDSF